MPPRNLPIQNIQLTEDDLKSPETFNNLFTQVFNRLADLSGDNGTTALPSGVDVGGSTITNVGAPQTPSDAISSAHAESKYSPAVMSKQLESGAKFGFKGYRSLNSKSQQEAYSTFLNRVTNTSPTTNSSVVTATAPSGGNVTITVVAGFHQFVDGSIIPYGAFSDTVAVPVSQNITGLTRSGGVSTATGTFSGLTAGESVYIQNASDPSFDGTFTLSTAGPTSFTFPQPGLPDQATPATGATVSTGGVYYFYLRYPSHTLAVDGGVSGGGYPSDTQQNRLNANRDGQVLIAVAVVNSSGLVVTQSAAGATPPATTLGNRIVSRL